jgi:arginase family enzyme
MKSEFREAMDPLMHWDVPRIYPDTPTFLAIPHVTSPEGLAGADVAIVGTPYQGVAPVARTYNNTIMTPIALRQYSVKYGGYLPELDLDVFERLRVVDYGDVKVGMRAAIPEALEQVADRVGEILDAGVVPIVLGGSDILSSLGGAMAVSARASGKIGTLSLDAHGDNLPEHEGERFSGATWVARMLELPHLAPEKHVQVGMRGPRNIAEQVKWFRDAGSRLYTMGEIRKRGVDLVTEEALSTLYEGTDGAYLTVDYDVMDIGCAPGLDEPYGLTVPELLHLMFQVGKRGVRGFGIGWIPAPEPGLFAIVIYSVLHLLAGMSLQEGRT